MKKSVRFDGWKPISIDIETSVFKAFSIVVFAHWSVFLSQPTLNNIESTGMSECSRDENKKIINTKKREEKPRAVRIHFYDDFPFQPSLPIIFPPSTFLRCVVLCCLRRFNKKVSILFALLKRKINFWFSEICIHSFNWFEYKWKLIRSIFSSSLVRDIYIVWIMVSLRLLHQ